RPRRSAPAINDRLTQTLDAVVRTLSRLARADVISTTRRDLQRCRVALAEAYDTGMGAPLHDRRDTEHLWPAVAATRNLVYRALAACWQMELGGSEVSGDDPPLTLFSSDGAERIQKPLSTLAAATRQATPPAELGSLPAFLRIELQTLQQALRIEVA
ncbi:MAG: hypothetical protein ABIY56_06830, partial [Dokdonella sp.]